MLFPSQNELESTVQQFEESDTRSNMLSKQLTALESQVADTQDTLNEETRQKLAAQSKLRHAEEKVEAMQDQLEDEEEQRVAMEGKVNTLTAQVRGQTWLKAINVGVNCVVKVIVLEFKRGSMPSWCGKCGSRSSCGDGTLIKVIMMRVNRVARSSVGVGNVEVRSSQCGEIWVMMGVSAEVKHGSRLSRWMSVVKCWSRSSW